MSNVSVGLPRTSRAPLARVENSNIERFVSGLGSGFVSAIILQPADLLKTRLQQTQGKTTFKKVFTAVIKEERGMRSLWRGTIPSALRTSVGSGLYFASLSSFREVMATPEQRARAHSQHQSGQHSSSMVQLSTGMNLLAGAVTRAGVGFVVMPITLLKIRFESDLYNYKSLLSGAKSIYTSEGIRGFFKGWGATAIRDAPNAALYLAFYETNKRYLSPLIVGANNQGKDAAKSAYVNAISGFLAGSLAVAVTNPVDTLKTRIQISPGQYTNMWSAGVKILREESFVRLFDGCFLRILRKGASSALTWALYEDLIARFLKNKKAVEEKL